MGGFNQSTMNPTALLNLFPAIGAERPQTQIPFYFPLLRGEERDFETEHDFLVQNLRPDLLENTRPDETRFAIDLP